MITHKNLLNFNKRWNITIFSIFEYIISDCNNSKLKKTIFFIASFRSPTVALHCPLSIPFIYLSNGKHFSRIKPTLLGPTKGELNLRPMSFNAPSFTVKNDICNHQISIRESLDFSTNLRQN